MVKGVFEQIVRTSGNSLVATIPKEVVDGMKISSGVSVRFLIEYAPPEIEFSTEKDGHKYSVSLFDDGGLATFLDDSIQETLELSSPPHLLALYDFIQKIVHDPELIEKAHEFDYSDEEMAFDEDEE